MDPAAPAASAAPPGYSTVSPYLIVDGADRAIAFLQEVFGAVEVRRFPDAEGRLMHAEARIGESVVMVADCAPPRWPAVPAMVHVYVADADATYRRALDAGAKGIEAPVQKGDEDKRGGFTDPVGTTWWVGQRMG